MSYLVTLAVVMFALGLVLARYSVNDAERFFARFMMGGAVVFAVIAFSIGCASSGATRSLQAGVVTAQSLDLHSTHTAIQSGRGREGNPVMPSKWWQQAAIKVPTTLGLLWATTQAEERGHPVLARLVLGVAAGTLAVISARNYQIARGQ